MYWDECGAGSDSLPSATMNGGDNDGLRAHLRDSESLQSLAKGRSTFLHPPAVNPFASSHSESYKDLIVDLKLFRKPHTLPRQLRVAHGSFRDLSTSEILGDWAKLPPTAVDRHQL